MYSQIHAEHCQNSLILCSFNNETQNRRKINVTLGNDRCVGKKKTKQTEEVESDKGAILGRITWGNPISPRRGHLNSGLNEWGSKLCRCSWEGCSSSENASAKALRQGCGWYVKKEQGDQVAGMELIRESARDWLGDSLKPDVRPSTGVARLLKTGASTSFPFSNDLFFFFSYLAEQ